MGSINRRQFLRTTTGALALAALDLSNLNCASNTISQPAPRLARSPNERINLAVIGLGLRSGGLLQNFGTKNGCRITHICDPDTATAAAAIEKARASNDDQPPLFVRDLRQIIDDKQIDAVAIVTPNHWHALASIWAMQAGKDVYVEKPIAHTIGEGRRMVQAAQRYGRVCQVGSQMRSNPAIRDAMQYIHSGALGKVLVSRALCYKTRNSIGNLTQPQQPPDTLDYNLWCGPAPLAPVMRTRFHYDWHWFWDFGNGDIGNQGVHELDVARWAIGADQMPQSVQSVGGRLGYTDNGETPNTVVATYDFGAGKPPIVMEVRGLKTDPYHSRGVENVVECENGVLVSPSYTSAIAYDRDGKELQRFNGGNDTFHFNNFVDVVRSGRMSDLNAPPLEGHLSAALSHLANISYRLAEPASLDQAPKDEAVQRMVKHLEDNGISRSDASFRIGRRLHLDNAKETFGRDAQANQLLTRHDRAPFVVPAHV
jgi:predicted dehydrogenase